MFENNNGKLLVYASASSPRGRQIRDVSVATEKIARLLNLSLETISFQSKFSPIYVYYKCGDEEPVPVYCTNGKRSNMKDIYASLRRMMFVLSFHPKNSALRRVRKRIIQLS
jgi:hypothetical protein